MTISMTIFYSYNLLLRASLSDCHPVTSSNIVCTLVIDFPVLATSKHQL